MKKTFIKSLSAIFCILLMVACGQAPEPEQTSFETIVLKKENRTLSTNFAAKIQGKQDVDFCLHNIFF